MAIASVSDRATQIHNKLQRKCARLLVGMVEDRFVTCAADSVDMQRWFDRKPERVVGVYDNRCPVDWIEDDLAYMAARYARRK